MQQLQRRTLHSKWKMSISQGDHEPNETNTTSETISQVTDSRTTTPTTQTPTKSTSVPLIQTILTPGQQTPQKKRLHSGD